MIAAGIHQAHRPGGSHRLGRVKEDNPKKRYFDNNSAIGLEPCITLIQQRISWLRGSIRYVVAALVGVAKNPQWNMHLQWEDGEYNGPATLVTAGNNPLTGGVFYMAPHADPFDGKLNCVYGYHGIQASNSAFAAQDDESRRRKLCGTPCHS